MIDNVSFYCSEEDDNRKFVIERFADQWVGKIDDKFGSFMYGCSAKTKRGAYMEVAQAQKDGKLHPLR